MTGPGKTEPTSFRRWLMAPTTMAGVLTGVGLLFLKGSQLLQASPRVAAMSRYIPAVSAVVILILGVGITVEAVWRLASSV